MKTFLNPMKKQREEDTKESLINLATDIFWWVVVLSLVAFLMALSVRAETNIVTVPALVERIDNWFDVLQNILLGLGAVVTALLGIWAKIKAKQAAVVPVLIRAIEHYGTDSLKDTIQLKAEAAGVEKVLSKLVESNTEIITKKKP